MAWQLALLGLAQRGRSWRGTEENKSKENSCPFCFSFFPQRFHVFPVGEDASVLNQ